MFIPIVAQHWQCEDCRTEFWECRIPWQSRPRCIECNSLALELLDESITTPTL